MKAALAILVLLAGASAAWFELDAQPRGKAWPVVRGSIGGEPVIWYVAFPQGEGAQLCPLESAENPFCRELEGLPLSELEGMEPKSWANFSTFYLDEPLTERSVPPEAHGYTRALAAMIAGSRARLPKENGEPAVRAEVRQPHCAGLAAWAQAHRTDDALYDAFTRHLSIGECSADPEPQNTARMFAELALARGDLPTFIDLQLRLIGNSFERVAYSNFAEERAGTGSSRLVEAGVDVDAVFLGLLIRSQGFKAGVDDWRLARAIREAGRTEALLPRVEAFATSSSLDPYNRFRATEVWLHLQVYDEATRAGLPEVKARAAKLELHPISRLRIDQAN